MQTTPISRVETLTLSRAEIVDELTDPQSNSIGARTFFDINGEGLSLYYRSDAYRNAVDQADAVHADGWIIVAASRWLTSKPIKERSATTDLIHDYAHAATTNQQSMFLLGGEPGLAQACADKLQEDYPSLRIAGTHHGFFDEADTPAVIEKINAARPDTVWVGFGKPKEQLFCAKYAHMIDAKWVITCGGCFNYVVGTYERAPLWMQDNGLEWLFRLYRNPRRMFWRYALTNPHSLYLLVAKAAPASR